jgi:hypothetical protein
MSSLLTVYNYYLNSKQRTSGTSNNFLLSLPNPISLNGKIPSEFRIKILSAVIPFAWNQINSKNYTTYWSMTRGSTYTGSFNIPSGNYNVYTLATAWISAIQTSISSVSGYTPLLTITYDVNTDKFTFTLTNDATPTTITLLNTTTGATQINLCLGFTANWSISNGLGATTVSTQQANVNPARNVYIQSSSLIQKNAYDAYVTPVRTSNIIEVIPVYTLPNQYIIFQPPNPTVSIISNPIIDEINLELGDESMDYDLQDFTLNWSLHMVVEEHRTDLKLDVNGSSVDMGQIHLDAKAEAKRQQLEDEKNKIIDKLNKEKNKLISALNTKDATQTTSKRS